MNNDTTQKSKVKWHKRMDRIEKTVIFCIYSKVFFIIIYFIRKMNYDGLNCCKTSKKEVCLFFQKKE